MLRVPKGRRGVIHSITSDEKMKQQLALTKRLLRLNIDIFYQYDMFHRYDIITPVPAEYPEVIMEYLYETHMHTSEVSGCADSSAAQQVADYKKRGYTGIIVTDHFINGYTSIRSKLPWDKKMRQFMTGYIEAKKVGVEYDLDVFLGWEFTIRGADLLTYGLDLDFLLANPGVDKFGFEAYSEIVRRNGGYLAQAHPYRNAYYIEHNYPVAAHLLDGVEVYNAMDSKAENEKALAYAKEHDLPMQAGTDSHSAGGYKYSGIKLNKKAESIGDIIEAIKTGNVTLI